MITTCHIAPGHWSGHMRIYHRFCHTLAGNGYEVSFIAHRGKTIENDPKIRLHLLKEPHAASPGWRLVHRLQRCRQSYDRALRSGADIYHFYSPEFIPWAIRLKRKTGKPVVFDCMEDFEGSIAEKPDIPDALRYLFAKFIRCWLSKASENMDAITVADSGTARLFQGGKAEVVVLHNMPRLELFPDGPRPQEPAHDLVFHGGLSIVYLKLILRIDDALTRLGKRVSWYLFGNLDYIDWFTSELESRHAGDRFTIGGIVPHDQVHEEVRRARIGIIPYPDLPKYHNNLPQKIFEFMCLRMPFVIGDMPPIQPFVADGLCAFLVEPSDPEAYASAVIRLIDNPSLCAKMGDRGRERVESDYSWEKESQKLLDLYANLTRKIVDGKVSFPSLRQ